jgi:hypothetical protein
MAVKVFGVRFTKIKLRESFVIDQKDKKEEI